MQRIAVLACLASIFWIVAPESSQLTPSITMVDGHEAAAREVLVKLRPGRLSSLGQLKQQIDVDDDRPIGGVCVRRLRSRTFAVDALVHYLRLHPDVEYAEPNYIVRASVVPNDPQFPSLWGLRNIGQAILGTAGTPGADIGAANAWAVSTGSTANVVGVIDTGIDYTHPDLVANLWTAPSDFTVTLAGGLRITCHTGDFGFNAITRTCDPRDNNNHGTHVAGTIAARGNNGTGVVGVNWTGRIMALKFLDASGSGNTSDAVDAIEFAIQAKALLGAAANVRVLSNSWGGSGFSQTLLDEINKANARDMLFVAAAGNNGQNNDTSEPFYPASFSAPNVIAVAATDNRDQLAGFSNYGHTTVDLGAPGVNILSTTMGNTYQYFNGTSMATPHVAGAAALVLSRCSLSTADLKTNLLSSVDPTAALAGITVTGGRLNVNTAIRSCLPGAPGDFSKVSPSTATTGQPLNTTLSWTASTGATSYEYCVDTSNNDTCNSSWTSTTALSAALSGLATATTYYWQVRAVNAASTTDADQSAWWNFTTQVTQNPWLDPAWAWRRPLTVANTTGGALSNYQVQVSLDATTFDFSRAQSDGVDLRVTDATGTVGLPFWLETWDATAQRATVWVKIPSVPVAGTTIYLYYGNAAATAAGSGTTTFEFYDGFEGLGAGAPPGGSGTFTWTYTGGITAVASPVRQGARSLQQLGATQQLSTSFAALSQGVVGAWLRRTTAGPGDGDIYLYTGGTLVATIGLGGSGRLHYWDGTFHDTAVTWAPNTWYLVTATFDATQRRFDFAVYDATGALLVRVPGLAFAGGSGGLSALMVYTSSAFSSTAFVDDVRLLRWRGTETTVVVGAQQGQGSGPAPGAFGKIAPVNTATGQPLALTLSWGASSNATSYQYCLDTTNNNTCDGNWTSTTSLSVPLGGLVGNTTYYWQVRGVNGTATTDADGGTWWRFTTQGLAPGGFAKAQPATGTFVSVAPTLSWTASSGAGSYEYCVDTTNNSACDGTWTSTTALSASLGGLATGTTYYWQVRAVNATSTTDADAGTWWNFTTQATVPWLDPAWAWRRPLTVANTTGGALSNYQVQVSLDATTFDFSRAQSDGVDLRVTDATGTVGLPFWLETWDATAQRATVWVKIPSVPVAGTTIYLYYGNAAATAAGSGTTTFEFYDGFEGLAIGAPPGGSGTFTWTYSGGITAVASPVRQGARSLQQPGPTQQLSTSFAALSQGVVGAWLQRATAGPGDRDIYLYTGGTLVATIGLGGSGRLHYWDGTFHDTAVTWAPNTWYLVTATFDATQRRFDFAVYDATGALLVRVPGLAFAGGSGGLSALMVYTSSAFSSTAFVDDVRLLRWRGTETTVAIGGEEIR